MRKLFIIVFIGLFSIIFGLFFVKWLTKGEDYRWRTSPELQSFTHIAEPLTKELGETIQQITYSAYEKNFFGVIGNSLKVIVLNIVLPFRVAGGFIQWLGS